MPRNFDYKAAFSQTPWPYTEIAYFDDALLIHDLEELRGYLDIVHIRECLLRPFCEQPDYPLVDPRNLLPSFEPDVLEYRSLPGFSMIAMDRPLTSFSEVFQYDMLHPHTDLTDIAQGECCPLENTVAAANMQTILGRLPRPLHEEFRKRYYHQDITALELYSGALPFLLAMDRAHVLSRHTGGAFMLSGAFASFPSDIDGELKRFGVRIGKFQVGNNELYEQNRTFVMQYLMELYGFPIASERRTSAALFARRLHKMGERFLVRVLGQSDRVLTTIWNSGQNSRYPNVEKIALIQIDADQTETLQAITEENAFVDAKNRVAIIRVRYRQHAFDADNVRQDRAISVEQQSIIHPMTGRSIVGPNVIRDSNNLILRLNDIAKGEYYGRIVYKRTGVIENTDTEEKRIKFLYAWLTKHQRRMIGYSEDFFSFASKILDNYMEQIEQYDIPTELKEPLAELQSRYQYIKQARTVRLLEDIKSRQYKGVHLSYLAMLTEAVELLRSYKFELSTYFDSLVQSVIHFTEAMLNDTYLRKHYIEKPEAALSAQGLEIRKKYGKLVHLLDEFIAIKKSHTSPESGAGNQAPR